MNDKQRNKQEGNGERSSKKNLGDAQKLESIENHRPIVREQFSTSCRICHSAISREKLISPCFCKGTLAFVHLSCLERWLNQSGRDSCELCTFRFEAEQTRRYSVCQGLRIWYRHPRHMSQLRADLVIGLVLTGVTLGLCSICVGGMKYFVLEGFRVGISYIWTEGVISFFLTVIVLGYFTTIYLMLRDHISPWYQWWNRCVNVRLILDLDLIPSVEQPTINPSTDTIMIPSSMSIMNTKMDHESEEREKLQNQNAIVYIPDISSTSINSTAIRPSRIDNPVNIPPVMSAILSHIIGTSIDRSNFLCQNNPKTTKDNSNNEEIQKEKIGIEDSKMTNESIGSTTLKINIPESSQVPSVAPPEVTQRTSSDLL